MYKLLLSWRYLRTRRIALASVISVTLGVATMIVVNSVMTGFAREMQNRIHGILSDLVIECLGLGGFPDPEAHMREIRRVAGDDVLGMTPTVVVPAMLSYRVHGEWITRQVNLIGVEPKTHAQVSDFSRFLQHPANRRQMSFNLREDGYDVRDHQGGPEVPAREQMQMAGWKNRRFWADREKLRRRQADDSGRSTEPIPAGDEPAAEVGQNDAPADSDEPFNPTNPFARSRPPENIFDPGQEQHTGAVLGIALAAFRDHQGRDRFLTLPGDDVKISLPTAGEVPKIVSGSFTIVDFYESKMNEYDSGFVFVPIDRLQEMRGMIDPSTGVTNVTAIQIKLRPGADGEKVRDRLRQAFDPQIYAVQTWRDKQGALLAAVQMETAILNILLFLIIAVAGFGILAIFYMIVVEKTRDIGILKSLGAPGRGVMGIFLSYGCALGLLGSGAGLGLGLLFVRYINEIADGLGKLTGRPVFDPTIYYFYRIPTVVEPLTVAWIVGGALAIAVLASVLPARRAAQLQPVEALRYE